jgi:hypothetical protein
MSDWPEEDDDPLGIPCTSQALDLDGSLPCHTFRRRPRGRDGRAAFVPQITG